jgi:DNA-binding transcriptional regulator YiaG
MYDEQELLMSLDSRPKAEPEDLDFNKIEKELRQAGHTSIFDQVSNQTSSISTPVMIKYLRKKRGLTSRKLASKLDVMDEINQYLEQDLDTRTEALEELV